MQRDDLSIPDGWRALEISDWHGPILVFGASDSGKSTFARYLYARLVEHHAHVGFLDTDIGQSSFGLPATITIALNQGKEDPAFPPGGARRVYFVGSNTPCGYTCQVLAGLYRTMLFALEKRADALVVDTSGFVEPARGGADLKWAKVEMLRPCTVVALQHAQELELILAPLRCLPGVRLFEFPVSEATRMRAREERRAYRAACYRQYFQDAAQIPLPYDRLAVFPERLFTPGRLVALENRDGFAMALALLERADGTIVWLRTPWSGEGRVAALHLGDLRIDLQTFQDAPL
jgi:polynucleotide 5'-hydroxyl-kinase GRC3/NOL9